MTPDMQGASASSPLGATTPPRLVVGCWPGRSYDANPFIRQFQDAVAAAGCEAIDVTDPRRLTSHVDVLHIHWPEQVFWGGGFARQTWRTLSTLRALFRLKRSGVKFVWMVHNLRPHELSGVRGPLWRVLGPAVARLADGFMTLSPATVSVVKQAFPILRTKPSASPWHPVPERLLVPDRDGARAAAGFSLEANVFAFLGLIRPYKGVEALIQAFRALPDRRHRLVVAGRCASSVLRDTLRHLADGDDRIRLGFERISDQTFAEFTVGADVVVLPFVDYLHSASIVHALSYSRPVLTPSAPYADALAKEVGPGWVQTYTGPLSPALLEAVQLPKGDPDFSMLDTAKLGAAARSLYETVMAPPAVTHAARLAS